MALKIKTPFKDVDTVRNASILKSFMRVFPFMAILGLLFMGILGVLIITGISFSLQRAGVAAGLAGVILGQLALSTVIDAIGLGGAEPIPLTTARILGLGIAGVGVYLLLPKA